MKIRDATVDDLPAILAIYNEAVKNSTASYDEEPQSPAKRQTWFECHCRDGYPVLVAEDPPGTIAGWSALSRFHPRPGYRHTAESSVYIHVDHRGRGIGRELTRRLIPRARKRGLHALLAIIDAENEASLRLHRALGFAKVGHFREVGRKFGRWLDVIYLELMLSESPRIGDAH